MKKALQANGSILLIYAFIGITVLLIGSYNYTLAEITLIILSIGLLLFLIFFKKESFITFKKIDASGKNGARGFFLVIVLALSYQILVDSLNHLSFIFGVEFLGAAEFPIPNLSFLLTVQVLVIAPIVEEFVFRKYLLAKTFQTTGNVDIAIFLSSFTFGLVHLPNLQLFVTAFFIGVISPLIYLKYKNIIYSVVFHFAFNLFFIIFKDWFSEKYYDVILYLNFNTTYWVIIASTGILVSYIVYRLWKDRSIAKIWKPRGTSNFEN